MDTRTGRIYETKEAAQADGVPENRLVTGTKPALRHLRKRLKIADRSKRLFRSFKDRK